MIEPMTDGNDEPGGADYTMSMVKANVIGLLAFPFAVVMVVAPYTLIHGAAGLKPGIASVAVLTIGFIVSIIAHEALHAFGFIVFAGAPRDAIRFGIDKKTLTPFAGCKVAVRARGYRIAALLPAIVLGLIPMLLSFFIPSFAIAIYAVLMIGAAGGDFAAVIAMRKAPGDAMVIDHPSRVGCKAVA